VPATQVRPDRTSEHPLRRDARVNQERVLAAAVTVMLRHGRQVPMAAIAAEAGLGVGTLYRHYANRDALLEALTQRSFELLVSIVREAEARDATALSALSWWWDRVIEERDHLVLPLGGAPPTVGEVTADLRDQLHGCLQRILDRGRCEGSIRRDLTVRDLVMFGAMLVTPLPGARDWTRVARRQKSIYIDGLAPARADG